MSYFDDVLEKSLKNLGVEIDEPLDKKGEEPKTKDPKWQAVKVKSGSKGSKLE